ncbi:MAG: hypothetical protein JOZ09_12815 [Pseudonocardiales bacterium]|jgi:hypothetical protein|nr:hypothetical protein [Pseudonocardiales bacterium]
MDTVSVLRKLRADYAGRIDWYRRTIREARPLGRCIRPLWTSWTPGLLAQRVDGGGITRIKAWQRPADL